MTDLEKLKFNLQENNFPYFSDTDLQNLLELYGSVENASYEGCLIKSYDDSMDLGSVLSTPNNSNYWIRLANRFKPHKKNKTMSRADGT